MTDKDTIQYLESKVKRLERELDEKPLSITGKVAFINPMEDVSKTAGKSFFTQNICLDTTQLINGTPYGNAAMFQFTGDNCKLIEGIGIGDKLEIKCSVKGKIYTKDTIKVSPLNPKAEGCITNLNGYEVTVIEKAKPSTVGSSSTNQEIGKKPDVIPAGYQWNELTQKLEAIDDLPF